MSFRDYIVLSDDTNTKLINTIPYEYSKFPGGEIYFKIKPEKICNEIFIIAKLKNSDDIMTLCMAVDAIKQKNSLAKIILFLPYIPYGRQDRVVVTGESFSIKVFAEILNNLRVNKIYTLDPHSDITPALINNLNVIHQHEILLYFLHTFHDNLVLVTPDLGAVKKSKLVFDTGFFKGQIILHKTRYGKNLESKLLQDFGWDDDNYLVVDDICDGGATFISTAKALLDNGKKNLYLYVTHGIFSNGFDELKKYYKQIFTTNSWINFDSSLKPFLNFKLIGPYLCDQD